MGDSPFLFAAISRVASSALVAMTEKKIAEPKKVWKEHTAASLWERFFSDQKSKSGKESEKGAKKSRKNRKVKKN